MCICRLPFRRLCNKLPKIKVAYLIWSARTDFRGIRIGPQWPILPCTRKIFAEDFVPESKIQVLIIRWFAGTLCVFRCARWESNGGPGERWPTRSSKFTVYCPRLWWKGRRMKAEAESKTESDDEWYQQPLLFPASCTGQCGNCFTLGSVSVSRPHVHCATYTVCIRCRNCVWFIYTVRREPQLPALTEQRMILGNRDTSASISPRHSYRLVPQ